MTTSGKWAAVHRVRLGHVRKLLLYRYGPVLPYDDAGREDLRILLHVKSWCYESCAREQALLKEIGLMAPWLDDADAQKLAAEIAANPLTLKSDTLGRQLNVDWRTRERLQIWQIGAVDLSADACKERRKLRHRERMKDVRRDQGAKPRSEYEAKSLSRLKPWEAEGISRRTWYRRQNREPARQVRAQTDGSVAQVRAQTNGSVAQVCAQSTFLIPDHTLVPRHERGSGKQRGDVSRVHHPVSGRRRR